ncbi:hypothetical protein D3C76_927710 [compost metagenome]
MRELSASTASSSETSLTAWILRLTSSVTARCSSAALEIWVAMSEIWLMEVVICSRAWVASFASSTLFWASSWPSCMVLTAPWVLRCSVSIMLRISTVELWVRCDSTRTSSATTAKPRPCSPARAASMAALSASRLVCSAMPWMVESMVLISWAFFSSSWMMPEACLTWVARSVMERWLRAITCLPCSQLLEELRAASAVCSALLATSTAVADISCTAVAIWEISFCWRARPWLDFSAMSWEDLACWLSCPEELEMSCTMTWMRSMKVLTCLATVPTSSSRSILMRRVRSPWPRERSAIASPRVFSGARELLMAT